MSKSARAMIVCGAVTGTLVVLAAALADPIGVGSQALVQHRLIAVEALVLIPAVASALALGIVIGRRKSGAVGPSMAITGAPASVDPVTVRAQAEAMTRAETEFLANMSHELHTPLNAVIGFAELILSEIHGPLDNRRYFDYVGYIRSGGEQLLAIVNDVLDMSQLAAGQLDLQPCQVEPWVIVEECARSVAASAAAAKVSLVVVRSSTAPSVVADPARLKQVLINLLSNAIKFTAPGGRVSVSATGHGDTIAFKVTDTGIGMTPGQIDDALQPFRMIENYMTRRQSGIGLGLPLAERLMRLHGGELRIESRPGCGTAVTAILPASASRPADEQ